MSGHKFNPLKKKRLKDGAGENKGAPKNEGMSNDFVENTCRKNVTLAA